MNFPQFVFRIGCVVIGSLIFFMPAAFAQQMSIKNQIWSMDVIRPSGQPIIPMFEGWFPNEDGTRTLCFGYNSLNTEEAIDIPLGENNYFIGSPSEVLLPTHFDPIPPRTELHPSYRRQFCVFTVVLPTDVGSSLLGTVEWHLTSAGETLSSPANTTDAYRLDEPSSHGRQEIAPVIRLTEGGERVRGRNGISSTASTMGKVNEPVQLSAWIEHPDEEIWIGWKKHTGPGEVKFDEWEYRFEPNKGPTTVQTTFSEVGRYVIRLQSLNTPDAFEFFCCHTTGYITVDISK